MNHPAFRSVLALLCGLILAVRIFAQTPGRIPLEYFFAASECESMRLSPDGKRVAYYTVFDDSKAGIELLDLETGKREPLVYSAEERIQDYFWKGNERIVFGGDPDARDYPAWCSIPIAPPVTGKHRPVVEFGYLGISSTLPLDPVHFLTGNGELIDARDDSRTLAPNFSYGPATEWGSGDTGFFPDNRGYLPIRTRVMGDKFCVDVMNEKLRHFDQVAAFPQIGNRWWLKSFAQDNETLYLFSTEKSDTMVLHAFNIRTRKLSDPLFVAPEGEITRIVTSWDKSKLYAAEYYSDRPHLHFFDAAREKLQQSIDAALPGTQNSIIDTSQDEQVLLIQAWSDRDPGTYYVLNRRLGRLSPVGRIRSRLDPAQMRPMEPVSFMSRDGLLIHGYLTRPAAPSGQRLPLIIVANSGAYGGRSLLGL